MGISYENFFHFCQASLVTLGPVYVGGAAAFEVKMNLKPGVNEFKPTVICDDLSKAVPIAATLLDDDSGWLEPFPPRVERRGKDGLPEGFKGQRPGVRTRYDAIKNFHATKDIAVKLNVGVKALAAGSHTCQFKFKDNSPAVDLTFDASEAPAAPPTNVSTNILLFKFINDHSTLTSFQYLGSWWN